MKLAAPVFAMLSAPRTRGSLRALGGLLLVFLSAVALFSVGFHALMEMEGRAFSWPTSIYWTIVTMSTLGFGDIVFESDLGRLYSVVVLLTGSLLILIILPFTFIQFVYVPWRSAMRRARTPRDVRRSVAGHLVVTTLDPMTELLIERARAVGLPYVLLEEDLDEAIALHDRGYEVVVGALDDPDTYRAVRIERAALTVTARSDQENTNVAFTIREVTDAGAVVSTANSPDAVDVLELAGCDRVLQLGPLLGRAFARRILAPRGASSVLGTYEDLLIAEAAASHTSLVGTTLAELDVRQRIGLSVVGVWDRGRFQMARPTLRIEQSSILVLAGTREQLAAWDDGYLFEPDEVEADEPHVVIIGGGRVGRAAAEALEAGATPCTIVERLPERVRSGHDYVVGDAADLDILRQAGIDRATAVVITTHDDDMNVYLTLYCRRLRPDVQLLGRVALDRNLSTMHRAGADFVLSYASTGATEAWNTLRNDATMLLAEGLVVFRLPVPPRLAGRSLREVNLPAETGCSVIGVVQDGVCATRLDVAEPLPADAELILIGDEESEQHFLSRYVVRDPRERFRGWLAGKRAPLDPVG